MILEKPGFQSSTKIKSLKFLRVLYLYKQGILKVAFENYKQQLIKLPTQVY